MDSGTIGRLNFVFQLTYIVVLTAFLLPYGCVIKINRKPLILSDFWRSIQVLLECGLMPSVMVILPNIGGALCSMPLNLA